MVCIINILKNSIYYQILFVWYVFGDKIRSLNACTNYILHPLLLRGHGTTLLVNDTRIEWTE